MFNEIDHIAILVRDTEKALELYRNKLGLPLLASEELEEVGVSGKKAAFIEPEGTQRVLFETTSLRQND